MPYIIKQNTALINHFRFLILAICLVTGLTTSASAVPVSDPGIPGPYVPGFVKQQVLTTVGMMDLDLYYPSGANPDQVDPSGAPYPCIIWGHGFARFSANHATLGSHLASWGFIVGICDFLRFGDHQGNSSDMKTSVNHMVSQNLNNLSVFYQMIDPAKFAMGGHKEGGMSAILAATDPRVKVMGLFDPTDENNFALNGIRSLQMPIFVAHSEPHNICTGGDEPIQIYQNAGAFRGKEKVYILNGSTCDFEEPSGSGCETICGSADSTRRYLARKYLTAWYLAYLAGEIGFYTYLTGPEAWDDVSNGLVQLDIQNVPIVPTPTATWTMAPSASPTLSHTPSPLPSQTPRPTWTASPTPTGRATFTSLPTSTPRPTHTAVPTSTLNPFHSSTPTPTPSLTASPTPTPMGPEPLIRWAGYMNSFIDSTSGGRLYCLAHVVDSQNNAMFVEVRYWGNPTGLMLYDNGTHGDFRPGDDWYTLIMDNVPSGAAAGEYRLEFVGIDSGGRESLVWPYFTSE